MARKRQPASEMSETATTTSIAEESQQETTPSTTTTTTKTVISEPKDVGRFHLVRSLSIADFVTLGNAACGISAIFFCLNYLENDEFAPYIKYAFILFPLALLFDILDGIVARSQMQRKTLSRIPLASPYGKDLDSLSDVVSFGVAPAVLAFTLGMRGFWDCVCLSYFVCCAIGRLARYNVTAVSLKFGGSKVKYYEGFPVPTSLLLVALLGYCYSTGDVGKLLWFGMYNFQLGSMYFGSFHPFCILFIIFGSLMISVVKIPKP